MAKYSTGDSSSSEDTSCQFCGETEKPLTTAKVEGATITVCKDCEPDSSHREDNVPETSETSTSDNSDTTDTTSTNTTSSGGSSTPGYTIGRTDSEWTEDVNYGNTETPYMQNQYAETLTDALETHNVTLNEIEEATGVPMDSLEALRNGAVVSEEVGRKEIEAVEDYLDIELIEDV